MARIPDVHQIEQIYSIVDQGVTAPLKCRLAGNIEAYVKYPQNYCGNRVLLNEIIGYSIAELVGVYSPDYGICNLSQRVMELFSDGECSLDGTNQGLCFFSVSLPKVIPKIMWNIVSAEDSAKIILLDHILSNCDRHDGNLLFDISQKKIVSIDYSHIFGKKDGIRPNHSLKYIMAGMSETEYLYNDILAENKEKYEELFVSGGCTPLVIREQTKKIMGSITDDDIDLIIKDVPDMWKDYVESGTIDTLSNFLKFRIKHLDKIAEMIINERRNK